MTLPRRPPDWSTLRVLVGGAGFVPRAIERMVTAKSETEGDIAYWELDNSVVVQGRLLEAAPWTARAVCEAICDGDATEHGLTRAFDLLFEIAAGESHEDEVALGMTDLGDRGRAELRRRVPCLRRFAASDDEWVLLGVLDVLEIVDDDQAALRALALDIAGRTVTPKVTERALELVEKLAMPRSR